MTSASRISLVCLLAGVFSLLAACGGSSSAPIAITLTASNSAVDQAQTANITATVVNDPKNAGVQWTVSGGGTLSNTSGTSATYVAPSSVTSTFTATVTATSVSDSSKTASVQISVNPLPTITTTSLPAAIAGSQYQANINASGGSTPFTWTISSGTLPTGLTIGVSRTNSVPILGTPTGAASTQITVMVKDSAGATASGPVTITVQPPPTLTITTASLPAGDAGIAYSASIAATGGVPSYQWTISGSPTQTAISASYTVASSGRAVVAESGSETDILYLISNDQLLVIPVDSGDSNPKLSWWFAQ